MYIKKNDKIIEDGLTLSNASSFLNNVKYNNIPNNLNNVSILGLNMSNMLFARAYEALTNSTYNVIDMSDKSEQSKYTYNMILVSFNNILTAATTMLFITDNANALSFKVFNHILTNYLNNTSSTNDTINILSSINAMMNSKVDPKLIVFNSSLKYYNAPGPSISVKEVAYCKDNISTEYVLRYDGKLKPHFIDELNRLYYKDIVRKQHIKHLKEHP